MVEMQQRTGVRRGKSLAAAPKPAPGPRPAGDRPTRLAAPPAAAGFGSWGQAQAEAAPSDDGASAAQEHEAREVPQDAFELASEVSRAEPVVKDPVVVRVDESEPGEPVDEALPEDAEQELAPEPLSSAVLDGYDLDQGRSVFDDRTFTDVLTGVPMASGASPATVSLPLLQVDPLGLDEGPDASDGVADAVEAGYALATGQHRPVNYRDTGMHQVAASAAQAVLPEASEAGRENARRRASGREGRPVKLVSSAPMGDRPVSVLAVLALCLAIVGFGPLSLVAAISGHAALADVNGSGKRGRGAAVGAIALGWAGTAALLTAAAMTWWLVSSGTGLPAGPVADAVASLLGQERGL